MDLESGILESPSQGTLCHILCVILCVNQVVLYQWMNAKSFEFNVNYIKKLNSSF